MNAVEFGDNFHRALFGMAVLPESLTHSLTHCNTLTHKMKKISNAWFILGCSYFSAAPISMVQRTANRRIAGELSSPLKIDKPVIGRLVGRRQTAGQSTN